MTTLTIDVDNQAILPSLRKILRALPGITLRPTPRTRAATGDDYYTPNADTIKAMREVQAGKGQVAHSLEEFIQQMHA